MRGAVRAPEGDGDIPFSPAWKRANLLIPASRKRLDLRGEERMGGGVSRAGDAFGDVARDGTVCVESTTLESRRLDEARAWGEKNALAEGVART